MADSQKKKDSGSLTAVQAERREIEHIRAYDVVQGNEIIRQVRLRLSLQEQKILKYCISMIKPSDPMDKIYHFTTKQYCEVAGICYNGKNNDDIKQSVLHIHDSRFFLTTDVRKERLIIWFSLLDIENDRIDLQFATAIQPFLFGLLGNFTQYSLIYILPMSSKYSIMLYELLKSMSFNNKRALLSYDLDILKRDLCAEKNYERPYDFRRNVLDVAVGEINRFTDLSVSYELDKPRAATRIHFTAVMKDVFDQAVVMRADNNVLDGQMSIYDFPDALPVDTGN